MLRQQAKKFGLFGFPLRHSLSPVIHKLLAQQFGIDIDYALQEVNVADLSFSISNFIAQGGAGLNITAPYKELVYQQMTNLNPPAKLTRAVNTIIVKTDGSIWGDNTDGIGFARDLARNALQIQGSRVLILGAGGAVRGILPALISLQPNAIFLFNRSMVKARKLSADIISDNLHLVSEYELFKIEADVIIHAISLDAATSLTEDIYTKINFKNVICYDLNYAPKSSFFAAFAGANGANKVIGGLGMLVEQAAAAFNLWHGRYPDANLALAQLQQITG